jgi:DNA-binding beta-propeller fold protein YncE
MRIQQLFLVSFLVLSLFLTPTLFSIRNVKAQDENPLKIEKVIGLSTTPGTFRKPTGIAVAKDGTIFIADSGESQIEVFDANLKHIRSFGSIGSGDGQFQQIRQLRIDENDNIYILDSFLCQIQVFSKDGKFLKKWGEKGTENNQLFTPNDFILLNKNEILIADSSIGDDVENTIKVFNTDGKYLRNFFKSTKYTNLFNEYDGLTIDTKGFVYINIFDFDYIDYRYLKFSQDGEYIGEFIKSDYKNEEFITDSLGCKVVNGMTMYLTDNNAVKKYEIQNDPKQPLKFVEIFLKKVDHDEDITRVLNPAGMFFHQGKIYIIDYYHNRIAVYDEKKQRVGTYQSPILEYGDCYDKEPLPTGMFSNPRGIAIGPDENIYIANSYHNEVDIYNYNWEEIGFFGFPGTKTGSMDEPFDIVFDQMGFCYVSDTRGNSILIFDKGHKYHSRINISDGEPVGLAINASGHLVICVSNYPADQILFYDISKMDRKK